MIAVDRPDQTLEPLPYHIEVRNYLKSQERDLWNWFASAQARADYTENLRMELLKSTYRLDAASHPELFQALKETRARLQLDIPVTLYQAQNSPHPNATLCFIPGEGHVVFCGPVLSLLNAAEIKSVLGHELAHYCLWQWDQSELHIADRLIQAVASDPRAAASHEQTARRFQLYTEIFADRGSLLVTGDLDPVVAGLVKIQTGLTQVSAAAYLKQAEEIFHKDSVATEGLSHPEAFIRARALALWRDRREDAQVSIVKMIEGAEALVDFDLMSQVRWVDRTRRLLEHFLQPKWFQTPAVLGHARLFFDDFQSALQPNTFDAAFLKPGDTRLREFICYVLLDFVTADPELDEMPLAAALEFSRRLEIEEQFEKLAARELKMKLREVRKLKEQAPELLAKAEAEVAR